MYYERKFAEAMLLIAGLVACLVMGVLLTTPETNIDLLANSRISDLDEATRVASIVADEPAAKIKYLHKSAYRTGLTD